MPTAWAAVRWVVNIWVRFVKTFGPHSHEFRPQGGESGPASGDQLDGLDASCVGIQNRSGGPFKSGLKSGATGRATAQS